MEKLLAMLEPHIGKPLLVSINDEKENLHLFNWKEFEQQHNEVISKAKGMTPAQIGDFLQNNETRVMEIYDYFMDDDSIEKVEAKEWLPIGVLGFSHTFDSYAEMSHAGLLLLDLSDDSENPPVLRLLEAETELVADSFNELEISVYGKE
jgi:hypothetical protein